MPRNPKRAAISVIILASLIFSVLVGVFAIYVVSASSGGVQDKFYDGMCNMNLKIKGKLGPVKDKLPAFACKQYKTLRTIDATDWKECSIAYKGNPKMCAAHQIVKESYRCWKMVGGTDPGFAVLSSDDNFACSKYQLINLPKSESVTELDLITVMIFESPEGKTNSYCYERYFTNTRLSDDTLILSCVAKDKEICDSIQWKKNFKSGDVIHVSIDVDKGSNILGSVKHLAREISKIGIRGVQSGISAAQGGISTVQGGIGSGLGEGRNLIVAGGEGAVEHVPGLTYVVDGGEVVGDALADIRDAIGQEFNDIPYLGEFTGAVGGAVRGGIDTVKSWFGQKKEEGEEKINFLRDYNYCDEGWTDGEINLVIVDDEYIGSLMSGQ